MCISDRGYGRGRGGGRGGGGGGRRYEDAGPPETVNLILVHIKINRTGNLLLSIILILAHQSPN